MWLVWFLMSICSISPIPLHFYTMHSSHYKVNNSLSSVWSFTLLLSLPGNCFIWLSPPHFLATCSLPALSVRLYSGNAKVQKAFQSHYNLLSVYLLPWVIPMPWMIHSTGWLNTHPWIGEHSKIYTQLSIVYANRKNKGYGFTADTF